ncbi:MAG: type II toxin-antitoxin system mRNA interferase toxin, RelE/StbE family [Planctomycetes bacterium]|nr:type II toxin-antitoxin system mRNA interferase toxin, RelE/StbE family [Planctomycetota bacterium]
MADPTMYADRLRKDLAGSWKWRVGDSRIVFDLDAARKRIRILIIAHRSVVYERVFRRRSLA